jgi:pyruvyltransferase
LTVFCGVTIFFNCRFILIESILDILIVDAAQKHLLFIGSIVEYCNSNSIICGAGIIDSRSNFTKPFLVLSVRGPLTRDRFIELGYHCPENYGDPALLLSDIYKCKTSVKKYKLGIIPHICDYDEMISFMNNTNCNFTYTIINFAVDSSKIENVINIVNECEYIISSSLHGINTFDIEIVKKYFSLIIFSFL